VTDYTFDITKEAVKKIKEALDRRKTPDAALRIGVRGGGCSGFTYHLEFCDSVPRDKDLIFVFLNGEGSEQIQVYIDKKSIIYLTGTQLDWEKKLMSQGFKFNNPQAKGSCGCNESFSV